MDNYDLTVLIIQKKTINNESTLTHMLTAINPKLPMRDKARTKDFYLNSLGFKELGDYGDYLMIGKDKIEIHFFIHH